MTFLLGALTVLGFAWITLASIRNGREMKRWLREDPFATVRTGRALLLAGALAATAFALALASSEPPHLTGASADVVLLLDVSRSMDTADTPPSRLRRAVRYAQRFVEEAEEVRLALVVGAGAAFPLVPLTQDRDAILTYLAAIDSEIISKPGTDLGRALRVAAKAFDPRSSRPRAVLLLSDGEHAGSDLTAAIRAVGSEGIRVVAVGFGTREGGIVPGPGAEALRDRDDRAVRSRRMDPLLERIARMTNGASQLESDAPPEARTLGAGGEAEEERERKPLPVWVILAALAVAIELLLSSPRRPSSSRANVAAVATAAAAFALLAAGTPDALRKGDSRLERGEAREALSLYRGVERNSGQRPTTRIRVGNALYRLGQLGAASAAFLDALRQLRAEDRDARFVAAFNLGTTLLAQERYSEARDALWTALLARPERREAKFNYEWAVERIEPEEERRVNSPRRSEREQHEGEGEEQRPHPSVPHAADERKDSPPPLEEREARRWLRAIDDQPLEPLRQQIAERLEAEGRGAPGGQTW